MFRARSAVSDAVFKRSVAAAAWFVSCWWAYSLIAYFLGLPADGGAVIGVLAAAFVALDPTGAFWGKRTPETTEAANADALGLTSPTP